MDSNAFLVNMGARISRCRKDLHMTQEQLAEKMGVSLQTISCIELGKKAVRPENLANLCTHLGVSADYILYGKRDEQQMSGLVNMLSALGADEYRTVQHLVELLYSKQ